MSFSENCRSCSVMVDKGSGVFIQPNTEEYSYILTAKHNLYKDYDNKKCLEPKPIDDIKLVSYNENIKLSILDKYELDDCDIDIAILKIKKVNKLFSPNVIENNIEIDDKCVLYGFPKNRRDIKEKKEEKIRNFKLTIADIHSYEVIVENSTYYEQSDIDGCSGGGVYKKIDNKPYLIGIEFRMDSVSTKEKNNIRLRFFDIKAFDKIIEKYSDELVYLDESKNITQSHIIYKDGYIEPRTVYIEELDIHVAVCPVTFEEYELYCKEKNIKVPDDFLFGKDKRPIINVSWDDANSYCTWLSSKNEDKIYRLPTSNEWELIALKNIPSDECIIHSNNANKSTDEVNRRMLDDIEIYDMYGNIFEWCSDSDGDENNDLKKAKGGSFKKSLNYILDSKDESFLKDNKSPELGFRLIAEEDYRTILTKKLLEKEVFLYNVFLELVTDENEFLKYKNLDISKEMKEIIRSIDFDKKKLLKLLKNIEIRSENNKSDGFRYTNRKSRFIQDLEKDIAIFKKVLECSRKSNKFISEAEEMIKYINNCYSTTKLDEKLDKLNIQ